jgi:Protein of unknown function (DUF998)
MMIELQQERDGVLAVSCRLSRGIALGAAAGPAVFTVAWLVLGFVSHGYTAWGVYVPYSPIHQTVSGLGLGATAPFMNAAFLANGVLTAAGLVAIFNGIPALGRVARWTCVALLSMPALGSAIDGIFTLESFLPHMAGFALVLMTIPGFAVTGFLLRRVPEWKRFGTWLVAASPLTLLLAVLFFATFSPTTAGTQSGIAGITERLLILEIQAWYVALAWTFTRRADR